MIFGVFLTLVFLKFIYWFRNKSIEQYKEWDINTCTPGDYTVLIKFTQKSISKFQDPSTLKETRLDNFLKDLIENKVNTFE